MATERIDIIVSERGSRVVQRNLRDIGVSARESSGGVDFLKRTLGTLGLAFGVGEIIRGIDAYNNLQNRLRSTGLEGKNLTGVYQALLKVSNDTRSSVEGSVELYSRLAISSKDLGISQKGLISFTKSLNQAILLSGASATEAQAGLIQLSQGMASGTLRGDELRSVLEQLPAVADVIAKNLGVTRGELRQMGQDGKITAQTIIQAFQAAEGELNERFGKTVPTIGQSFQILKNAVTDLLGKFNDATGITAILSKSLVFVANNLETILKVIVSLGAGWVIVSGGVAAFNAVRNAVLLLNAAIAANPIGFLLTVLTSAITALTLFRDQIKLGTNETTTLGDLMRAVGEKIGAALKRIWEAAKAVFGPLITLIQDWVGKVDFSVAGILKLVAKAVDFFFGAWSGAVGAVVALFKGFGPAINDLITSALNAVLRKIGNFVNGAGKLLSSITEFAGLGQIAAVDFTLTNENAGAAKKLGQNVGNAFRAGLENSTAQDFVQGLFDRADQIGAERAKREAAAGGAVSDAAGPATSPNGGGSDKDKAKKATRDLAEELKSLVSQYDRVYAAQQELAAAEKLLTEAQNAGLISAERKAQVLGMVQEQLKDQLDPLGALNRELNKELELLKLTADARDIEAQARSIQQDLLTQGIALGDVELKQLREKLELIQKETKLSEARNRLTEDSRAGRDAQFGIDAQALKEVMGTGAMDAQDQFNVLNSMLGGSLDGTQAELDARAAQIEEYFSRIQILRDQNVINEQTASDAIRAIKQAEVDFYLERTASALGAASALMQTNSKKAFKIGQAAAIGETIVNTYASATAAYKSAANIPYVGWILGPAAAAGAVAAGMAQVSAIRSQQMPAYRTGGEMIVGGSGGVDSQTVAFRATPGERVSINTPQQASAMQNVERMMRQDRGSRGNFTQNLTIVQQGRPNRRTTEQEARKVRKAAQAEYERN